MTTTPNGIQIQYLVIEPPCKVTLTVSAPGGAVILEQVNLAVPAARERFTKQVCESIPTVEEEWLKAELVQIGAQLVSCAGKAVAAPPSNLESLLAESDRASDDALSAMSPSVVAEAEAMLRDPAIFDRLIADFTAIGIVGESELALTIYLIGTSRLLTEPLSGISQGLSSSGKTFVIDRTGRLFPEEALIKATEITANALYYLPFGALMHKFVINGERRRSTDDEHAEATRALRQMLSDKELCKVVPVKGENGKPESRKIHQPGPIAYVETTTRTDIFNEDANRCMLLGTDESQEQTARIVAAQARAASGPEIDCQAVFERHHAFQRLLKRVKVSIPFAGKIAQAIPTKHQEARRAMPQILSMIKAVALLQQQQRKAGELDHGDAIEATLADYVVARRLLVGPMGRSLGGALPGAAARFGKRVRARYGDEEFSSTEAARNDDAVSTKSKANEYLKTLADAGIAEQTEPSRGAQPARWKMLSDVPDGGSQWLPTVDQLQGGES